MRRTSIDKIKENGFKLTKERSKSYPAKTITDDIALLARAAAGIGLHINAHKTEYMCLNQRGDISILNGNALKLVDKFTYLGSSVSSPETDIDTRLAKAWTAIDWLSVVWKSDLTDKMKRSFFQVAVVSILLYGCTTWKLTKRMEKKLDGNFIRMLYFDPSPRPKNAIPRWYTGRKWHIPTVSNRKRSCGRIKAYDMGQGEGLIVLLQSCTGRE